MLAFLQNFQEARTKSVDAHSTMTLSWLVGMLAVSVVSGGLIMLYRFPPSWSSNEVLAARAAAYLVPFLILTGPVAWMTGHPVLIGPRGSKIARDPVHVDRYYMKGLLNRFSGLLEHYECEGVPVSKRGLAEVLDLLAKDERVLFLINEGDGSYSKWRDVVRRVVKEWNETSR